jgi:DNA polymerase III delta prime subunit
MADFFEDDSQEKREKQEERNKTHTLWVERYRPLKLADFIGNELIKEKAKSYIETNDVPHLLLYGKAGGGKTTLAKILGNTINCDCMYINASSENSVDNVREKITGFAVSVGFKPLKVIILDEADFLTPQAQAALRNLMETFSQTTRFILTGNYVEKIIEPIISRCQVFHLVPPSKKEVATYVYNILRRENVEANPADLKFVFDSAYPDIRRIINIIQKQTVNGVLTNNQQEMIDADYKLKVIEILTDKRIDRKTSFKNIRQILADNSITQFSDMYSLLYDRLDDYATGHLANVIVAIAEYQFKDAMVVDHEINFMAMIISILNEVKQ